LIAAIILLIGLFVGLLAGLADALRARIAERAVIETRLDLVAAGADTRRPQRSTGPFWGGVRRTYDLIQHLFALGVARRWGVRISPLSLFLSALLGGAVAWFLARVVLESPPWLSVTLTAAATAVTPRIMLRLEQKRMEAHFLERFPDAVDMVVRALRAGVPLTAAVRAVATEAAPPVDAVFGGLADQTEIGVPLNEALAKTAQWIRLPDFRFFAVAVGLQYATGGNLAATLDSLSEIVRKRRVMRLKAKAVSAEVRLSTYILSALPFLVVGALLVVSPGYLKPMITDRRGNWILGAAIGSMLTGLFIMRNMMNSVSSD
jgi:tight adherence protein B